MSFSIAYLCRVDLPVHSVLWASSTLGLSWAGALGGWHAPYWLLELKWMNIHHGAWYSSCKPESVKGCNQCRKNPFFFLGLLWFWDASTDSTSLFFPAPLRRRAEKVLYCSFPGTCLILSHSLCCIHQLCHHAGCFSACILASAHLAHCWHAVLTGAGHMCYYEPTILQANLQEHTWTEMDGLKAWMLILFPSVRQMLCCTGVSLYLSVCLLQGSDNLTIAIQIFKRAQPPTLTARLYKEITSHLDTKM